MFQEKKNRIFLKRSKWIVDKTLEMAYFSNNHNNNNNIKPKKKIMQQTETNCGSIDDLKRKQALNSIDQPTGVYRSSNTRIELVDSVQGQKTN